MPHAGQRKPEYVGDVAYLDGFPAELISEELVPHAKPRSAGAPGREAPTVYRRELAKVQIFRLHPEGPHGPLFEVRIVHPGDDEPDEVNRFIELEGESGARAWEKAVVNSLRGSLLTRGLEDIEGAVASSGREPFLEAPGVIIEDHNKPATRRVQKDVMFVPPGVLEPESKPDLSTLKAGIEALASLFGKGK